MGFRIFLGAFALLLTALPAAGQISIGAGSFPSSGSYTAGNADAATFDVGSAGPNQTWTFGNYAWDIVVTYEFLNPASTPYAGSFPTATRATRASSLDEPLGGTYIYERIVPEGYYVLGMASAETLMTLVPPALMAPLPVTYQSNWTTVMRAEFEIGPLIRIAFRDSSTNVVDGWGTLQTPYGTSSVLRVFVHHWTSLTLNGVPLEEFENLEYAWFNDQGVDVVSVMSEDYESDPNFTTGYLEMLGAPLNTKPLRGPEVNHVAVGQNYPNPFNSATFLLIDLETNGAVNVEVYDETGRLVSHQTHALTPGHHVLPVDGSAWTSGTYFARVKAGDVMKTVQMMLIR